MVKILWKIVLAIIFLPVISYAFRLSPMVVHFKPSGSKMTQVLTLENPSSEKMPVQIEAFERTSDEKGEEIRTKTEDFTIYPEQVVLLPKEKRNVRVTWVGQITDDNEKAYRIVASQLPIEFRDRNSKPKSGNNANLNFLIQYVASAYVTPDGATPKIRIKEIKADKKKVTVTVSNEGSAHQVLHPKALNLYSGETLVATISPVAELEGANLLPKKEKTVVIQSPKEISARNLRGEFDFSETKN